MLVFELPAGRTAQDLTGRIVPVEVTGSGPLILYGKLGAARAARSRAEQAAVGAGKGQPEALFQPSSGGAGATTEHAPVNPCSPPWPVLFSCGLPILSPPQNVKKR